MEKFYVRANDGACVECEGERVNIPGFEGVELFIHRLVKVLFDNPEGFYPYRWHITEVSAGGVVAKGSTRKEAIDQAMKNLSGYGIKDLKSRIRKAIKKYGKFPD